MRVSFLVLLASLCLSAVLAATPGKKKEHDHSSTFVNDQGFEVQASGKTVVSEDTHVNVVQVGDVIEEEEITKVRTSTQGKRKGKRKKENWEPTPVVHIPCEELLVSEKNECIPADENQVCNFSILSEDNCAFECKCEAKIKEVVEEVVEEQVDGFGARLVKNKRKRVREGAEAGERKGGRRKQAGGKECAGEKKLSWQNCLIKMKGLIAWGENTANFDEKFNALK